MPTLRALFAPGYICTPQIWEDLVPAEFPDLDIHHVTWPRGLTTVAQARDHLAERITQVQPYVVVGHSMGGVLLLDLLATGAATVRRAVVVDAFTTKLPREFFRNFLWSSDPAVATRVHTMLDAERPLYPELRQALAAWPIPTWPKAAVETGAYFMYGGRGAATREDVLAELEWPPELLAEHESRVYTVLGTSHFLMMEKPSEFYALLGRIVRM